jgi:hypothetical protein
MSMTQLGPKPCSRGECCALIIADKGYDTPTVFAPRANLYDGTAIVLP